MMALALVILTCLFFSRPAAAQNQDPCADDAALSSPDCAPEIQKPSLRITQAFGAVVVIWNDFAGNDYGYELFRDGLPYHSAAAGETSFVDRLAIDGQNYSYAVRPMVVEPELAGRATVGKTAYIQNSAWSNLDPGDAVRTADAQTMVNELKSIDASDRDIFLGAITGDSTLAVDPASEEDVTGEGSDASPDADAKPAGIATFSLMETVLDAETDDDRDSATVLINEFLEQQGSNRRLYSVFGLTEYNPNSNQQHRLIAETFNEIRSSLLSLDFNQLDSSTIDSSITEVIIGLLDNARGRGLKLTQTRGKASEAQENAASGQSDDSVAPATAILLQPVLPDSGNENYQPDTDAADADEVARVEREAPAETTAQTPSETETPNAAQTQVLQPTLSNANQPTVIDTDAGADGTDSTDLLQPTVARTLELDQGVPQQQLSTDSAGREILDLNVQPGQGFETLSLDQPIPSGDGDLIDLDPSTNDVKLETLPVQ